MIALWNVGFSKADNVNPQKWESLSAFLSFANGTKREISQFANVSLPKGQTQIKIPSDLLNGFTPNLVQSDERAFWVSDTQVAEGTAVLTLTYEPLLSHAKEDWKIRGLFTRLSSLCAYSDEGNVVANGFLPFDFPGISGSIVASRVVVPLHRWFVGVFDTTQLTEDDFRWLDNGQWVEKALLSPWQWNSKYDIASRLLMKPYLLMAFPFDEDDADLFEAQGTEFRASPQSFAQDTKGFKWGFTIELTDEADSELRDGQLGDMRNGIDMKLFQSTGDNQPYVVFPDAPLTANIHLVANGNWAIEQSLSLGIPFNAKSFPPYVSWLIKYPLVASPIPIDVNRFKSTNRLRLFEIVGSKHYISIREDSDDWLKDEPFYDETLDIDTLSVGAYASYVNTNPQASWIGRTLLGTASDLATGSPVNPWSLAVEGVSGTIQSVSSAFARLSQGRRSSQIVGTEAVSTAMYLAKGDSDSLVLEKRTMTGAESKAWECLFNRYGNEMAIWANLGETVSLPPKATAVSTDFYKGYRYVKASSIDLTNAQLNESEREAVETAFGQGVEQYAPSDTGVYRPWKGD